MSGGILLSILIAQQGLSGSGGAFAATMPAEATRLESDLAALSIQDQGIHKLEALIKTHRGTREESELLLRLGDLYLERSGLSFRISEGKSVKERSPLHTRSLRGAIDAYSRLLREHPDHPRAPFARFKRGKALTELGNRSAAKEDYLHLVQNQPRFPLLDSALMDLATFEQDQNQHEEALRHLSRVRKMPGSPYFAMSIHKAAWSEFNLGRHQEAIRSLLDEIRWYQAKTRGEKSDSRAASSSGANNPQSPGAETALLESAFHDLALFHFEAIHRKQPFASVEGALRTFREADPSGTNFGRTALGFAKLLKAYTLTSELESVKNLMLRSHRALPETAEITLLVYQMHFEKRRWDRIADLAADSKLLKNATMAPKIEALISRALADLHQLVLKNKKATQREALGEVLLEPLVSLTASVQELLGRDSGPAILARYALAETLFEVGEHARAGKEYEALLDSRFEKALQAKKITPESLRMRLLSALYRDLETKGLIPEKMPILALRAPVFTTTPANLEALRSWVGRVDRVLSESGQGQSKSETNDQSMIRGLVLQAKKAAYLYWDRPGAVDSLLDFGKNNANTPEGKSALSLALDTYRESKDWNHLCALAEALTRSSPSAPAESAIEEGDFMKGLSVVRTDCKTIHAKALVASGDSATAETELTGLLTDPSDPTRTRALLLLRAEARRSLGKTEDAMSDLEEHQQMTRFADGNLTRSILEYRFMTRDEQGLKSLLATPSACSGMNSAFCAQIPLIRVLDQGQERTTPYPVAFRNTIKAPPSHRALWALIAIKNPAKLPFQDRLVLLQRLGQSYESLSPSLQVRFAPLLIERSETAMRAIRQSAPGIAPLRASPGSIERRMRLMAEIDLAFSKVMRLSWAGVKKAGLRELEQIHADLVAGLRAIHTPDDLLKPFQNKLTELASAASKFDEVVFSPEGSDPRTILLSNAAKEAIPAAVWEEWRISVESGNTDYLFHLAGSAEQAGEPGKSTAPVLRGLVLAMNGTGAEGLQLIEEAPDSALKKEAIRCFERRKQ